MNRQVYQVTAEQLQTFYLDEVPVSDRDALMEFAVQTKHLFIGLWSGRLLCVIGLMENPFATDQAYLWFQLTPLAAKHPIIIGRLGLEFVQKSLGVYSKLIGHCTDNRALPWIDKCGAKFCPGPSNSTIFEIEAH